MTNAVALHADRLKAPARQAVPAVAAAVKRHPWRAVTLVLLAFLWLHYGILGLLAGTVLVTWLDPTRTIRRWWHDYTLELLGVVVGLVLLAASPGPWWADWLIGALVLVHPLPRAKLRDRIRFARTRAGWEEACYRIGYASHAHRDNGEWTKDVDPPRLSRVTESPTNLQLVVAMRSGRSVEDLAKYNHRLASFYDARSVEVKPDPEGNALAHVTIWPGPDLLAAAAIPWQPPENPSLWGAIMLGKDAYGHERGVRLTGGGHMLIGGQTGYGKSVLLRQICTVAALDPDTHKWLFDGSGSDLLPFKSLVDGRYAMASDAEAALKLVTRAVAHMDERFAELRAAGKDKFTSGEVNLLVFDEVQKFLCDAKFTKLLFRVISEGRKVGFVVVGATQKPEGAIIKTYVRDQFVNALALRCKNTDSSDTILGKGTASQDPETGDASRLPIDGKGLALLHGNVSEPVRIRLYNITQQEAEAVVAQAGKGPFTPQSGLPSLPTPLPTLESDPLPALPQFYGKDEWSGQAGGQCGVTPIGDRSAAFAQSDLPASANPSPEGSDAGGGQGSPRNLSERVIAAIRADPTASNRALAESVGCSQRTIGNYKRRLSEELSELSEELT